MRIARIIEYFPPHIGGMERHGMILSREQVRMGHTVDIFIGYGDEKLLPSVYKMPLQFLPLYSKIRRIWFNIWAYYKVKKRHHHNPYDIIHLHGDFIEAYFGGKFSKKTSIPVILTIHAGLNKKLVRSENLKFFIGIKKIICVSEEIKQDLEYIGVESGKISIITSGIYLDDFKGCNESEVAYLRHQYSKPIIVSTGVLRINKGFTYLIEAFRKIKERIGSATLLIIGNGPERNNLERQAALIPNIHFLGRQEHDKLIKYLKDADIFVLASISTTNDREGTPTSIMEAMAAGLPVVATKVGGSTQLIRNGVNGFLINQADSSEITRAVLDIINNTELTKKIIAQNLEDIKEKDWLIIAKKITDIYQSLL